MASTFSAEHSAALQQEIASADKLLVVAAAGLSIHNTLPNNPYHSEEDFALHYPQAARYGYKTGYHAMTLAGDKRVPSAVRKAHTARHFLNMWERYPPTPAYAWLKELSSTFKDDDVFAWTSNVDGCFARSGFDPAHVYTTQGEMNRYPCSSCSTVWNCVEQLKAIDAASEDGILNDESVCLRCTTCGATEGLMPNLRGGDWFIHKPYAETQDRLLEWMDDCVVNQKAVAVLEIGVGANTPIVTRIPAAAFASAVSAAGGRVCYLRVNPDGPEPRNQNPVGDGVTFRRLQAKWDVLEPFLTQAATARADRSAAVAAAARNGGAGSGAGGASAGAGAGAGDLVAAREWQQEYVGILHSLRTPRGA